MSTDQRRFEVFVSSTYGDLREARQRVTMTLLECDAFPTGMEIFPATDDDAWTLIRRIIDGCDYYLLVIAGKYGSVNETSSLSYTEILRCARHCRVCGDQCPSRAARDAAGRARPVSLCRA
jgi:hypothetical protein